MAANTYSFLDVACAISGPGGDVNLSTGVGVDKGGITMAELEDKATMVVGADGAVMHSLHASKAARVTIRLQKTSAANAALNAMYRYQTTSAAYYGQNTITVRDPVRGDIATCQQCGFVKHPDLVYAEDGGIMEWTFNCGIYDPKVGDGFPISNINQGAA